MSQNLKPFPKGVSGNPGGKTKADLEIEAFARLHAKAAIDVLVKEMANAPLASDRITAANRVLERAYGKPKEHMTVAHDRSVSDRPDFELEAIIAAGRSGNGITAPQTGTSKPH